MNALSWLIYLADVAGNLDAFFFALMIISIIGGVIWLIVGAVAADDNEGPDFWKTWRKVGFAYLLPIFFIGTIIGSIIPSRDTVYAIAASEMGEKALNTSTANKAFKALDAWLDQQIAPAAEGDKK